MINRVGQHFGNYQLVQLLGQGGAAEVYLGKHRYLNSYAALKVLHARLRSEDEPKFLAEAQTLVDLRHPNIVRLLDFGIENGTPVLIMDYAPKGSLRQAHAQGTQIPLTTVVDFVTQIAAALQYAHNHNIIHRDVKPENILLDTDNHLLLSDFGLALLTPSLEELSTQNPAGTPRYMAPEQWHGKPSFASDQYALAIMVYEWLCGKLPFQGTLLELMYQHLHTDPPPLRTIRPDLPPALEAVVRRAMAKKPQDRFVSVQAFALALARTSQADTPGDENASQVTAPLQGIRRSSPIADHAATLIHQIAQIPTRVLPEAPPKQPPAPTLQRQNRMRLLRRVRAFWITGVLEQSLHGAALLALGLQEQPDAVANPWHLLFQHPDTTPSLLPTGTRITQVYDDADGELLILGAPGSGKTTLLLELAHDLLARAERDEQHPMPIVFNLSSWAIKQQPLLEWFIEEMNTKYQIPRKLARSWIETDQVLPLLDGLDEVASEARTACIEAISTYRQEHGFVPMVVCSRSTEYAAQTAQIHLQSAIVVQPLTMQQVDEYLSNAGGQLETLRVALHNDQTLQELVTTPLMLSILTLAYHGQPLEDLLTKTSSDDIQHLIFATYVERMLERRRAEARYTPQQTISWLTWLAHQMKQHNQTQFFIERMQMDWLPKNVLHQLAPSIVIGLLIGLVTMLCYAIGALPANLGLAGTLRFGSYFGLLACSLYILLNGLVFGLGTQDPAGGPVQTPSRLWAKVRHNVIKLLGQRVVYGFIFGISLGSLYGWFTARFGPGPGLSNILLNTIGYSFLGKLNPEIQPVEVLTWSWRNIRRIFVKFLGFGLLLGLVFVFCPQPIIKGLTFGLLFGLVSASFYSLIGGLSSRLQDERHLTKPNQGIWHSARNSVSYGLIIGLASGLLAGTVFGLLVWFMFGLLMIGLGAGINIGATTFLSLGTLAALRGGGIACIQHVLLRWHLWRAGSIPWNYPRFLDYTAEHILLRKVGGGYIFVHRLLLEYFASLAEAKQGLQQSLMAIAHVTLEDDNTAFVGKSYTTYAGISRSTPDDFVSEALKASIRHSEKPIPFDICLHTSGNIALTTPWHKYLLYDLHNLDSHLIEFTFQVTLAGKSYVVVDFYHERHWLRTLRFDFESIEHAKYAEFTFGV